jgi:fatty-acyl-CoA synthase
MGAYDYPLIIKQLLITPLRQFPWQEIVYRDRLRMTYRDFGERVARLGSALAGCGVRPGDTVAVMDWDSHRYLECFFAIPMLGAVLQTVNIRLSPEQILYTLNHTGAGTVLCNTEFLPVLTAILPEMTASPRLICIDDDGLVPDTITWHGEYEDLLTAGDPAHVFPDFDERTKATTFYTTGTTGLPKGVFYSHRQVVLHALSALAALPLTSADVYMPITPMFHVQAWGNPYVTFIRGMKHVYPGRYIPELLVRLFVAERVTFSHCVPTIMQMFLGAAEGVDLRGWLVVIGGSALARPLARTLLARGVNVFSGYGMSETGPIVTVSQPPAHLADGGEGELATRCRAGRPVPLVDLRIIDARGHPLPNDGLSAGEVVLRAPWLTMGYTKNPQASAALWEGGWLHTGDIGTVDEHGFLQITDRIKDVVKTGGEWVSSLALEDIIASHPSVAEVAVIGLPDARWGERPVAIVVCRAGAVEDEAGIRALVMTHVESGELSKYALPDKVVFASAIAKTSVGKLDKKLLRKQYEVGGDVPSPPNPPSSV